MSADVVNNDVPLDPVCAIHGIRWSKHDGGACLYCCICFSPLKPMDCVVDNSGVRWDVCKGQCAVEAGITELLGKEA